MLKKATASLNPASRAAALGIAAFVASLSATMTAMADNVIFPDGKTDIASAEDWGGTLPGTTDQISIGGNGQKTVTALDDVEFGGLLIGSANGQEVIFDMRPSVSGGSPRRIRMNGIAHCGSNWNAHYWLRGGFWDFGDNSVGIVENGTYNGLKNCSATIDGGAVVVCGSLVGHWRTTNNWVNVEGEGTIVTTKVVRVSPYNGIDNGFRFSNGAKVVLSGAGSRIVISDGDSGASYRNSLLVSGGASVEQTASGGTHYLGSAGSRNKLSVEGGSEVSLKGLLYFGHHDDSRANTASHNRIEVTGANSRLSTSAIYCGNASGVAASAGSSNNVAYVTDGGTLSSGDRWYLYGHDNGIVVSNGTVTLAGGGILCRTSTNCYLRLQGTHPSFVSKTAAGSQSEYKNGFTIHFDLPGDGYDGSVPWPFVSENYAFVDSSLRIEIEGVEGMAKRIRRQWLERETVNLAHFSGGVTGITDAMLARWNAALPELASLSFANNKLTLTVKANAPTVMTFR